jgi:hypothetical protein
MNTTGFSPKDIICCDVRGDLFYAFVAGRDTPKTTSDPMALRYPIRIEAMGRRPIPRLRVKASEVVGHWRKSKQSQV